jgi:hypothetical protein
MSVEDTESNTLSVCGDHSDRVDIRWLQICLLDPNGVSRSNAKWVSLLSVSVHPQPTIDQDYWGD